MENYCRECGINFDNSDEEYIEDVFMNNSDPICIQCAIDLADREMQRNIKLEADVMSLSIKLKNVQKHLKEIINNAQEAHLKSE